MQWTMAERINAVIASVTAVDGELIVVFSDGSEIALTMRRSCIDAVLEA